MVSISAKGIDILSIDAKDLYISNNYKSFNSTGYNIRDKNNNINVKKFINSFDYSKDLIILREVYEKVYRNTQFSFKQNRHEYTTRVINVTFKYNVGEFNKVTRKIKVDSKKANRYIYVKFGYNINQLEFNDCACIIDNELVGIIVDEDVINPYPSELLGKYFSYIDGKYKLNGNIKALKTRQELRDEIYENGFYCDGIKYTRLKRSTGSSRVGKCLFVDEKLYPRFHKWEMCGLQIKNGEPCDLAGLEASISLTTSSIIDTIDIDPKSILIIDDFESCFMDNVIETTSVDGNLVTKKNRVKIKNLIWDGQSLIDILAMGKYSEFGMILLREQFFKSCCFNTNLQKWFADNGITDISQLNGFTLATDIKDIKLITTPSSIKYLKFGKLKKWLSNIDGSFGIVKHEKPTHFFGGRMVNTHYQLLNTLQMTHSEVGELLKPTFDYINLLKSDVTVLRSHIKFSYNEFKTASISSQNDIVYKLLGLNDKFADTKWYYDFRSNLIKSMIKTLRSGHVLVNGNYSTMVGNPIEMLQYSINQFDGQSQLGIGNVHSKRFEYGIELLGSRSPHVCQGNVWVTKNTENEMIDKYLNITNEIICVNSIKENLLNRLSGCD